MPKPSRLPPTSESELHGNRGPVSLAWWALRTELGRNPQVPDQLAYAIRGYVTARLNAEAPRIVPPESRADGLPAALPSTLPRYAVVIVPRGPWPDWLGQAFACEQETRDLRLYDPAEALLLPNGHDSDGSAARAALDEAALRLFDYGCLTMHFDCTDSDGQDWHVLVLSDS